MEKIILRKSHKPNKKFDAVFPDGKIISFGDSRYKDYTLHDKSVRELKKQNYISRHEKREDWNDIKTPGFWSKNILWNKPTISASIRDTNKNFGISIKLYIST